MQDVSCNEITALPQQIGQLKSLRELNVRRNYLKVLPQGKKKKEGKMNQTGGFYYVLFTFVKKVALVMFVCAY